MASQAIPTTVDGQPVNNPVLALADTVGNVARARGVDTQMAANWLQTPADAPDGHVIPDFMTDGTGVAGAIRDGLRGLDFTLRETQDGEAKTQDGSHFTAVAVREAWAVDDVVGHLIDSGQWETAAVKLAEVARDDVNADNVVAWAVVTYLKGVVAERLLTATDRFSKAGVSNDQAGDDVYVTDGSQGPQELRQVKCVTHDEQKDDHIYYQFDARGQMWYGEDYKEVANRAIRDIPRVGDGRKAEVEITGTLTRRTHSNYRRSWRPHISNEKGGTVRYINW